MKETFYFSHDYNSRNDEKILKLIQNYGWEGYGIYWAIIEKLYEADGFIDEDYECIAFDLRTECERIKSIIKDFNLFQVRNKKISSKSCLARLRLRKGKSEKARQSANIRWNKQNIKDANALRTQSEGNAIKESKVKESKVKESKVKENTSELSSQVNQIMDIFYNSVNPSLNYGNKTTRGAAEWMIKKWGLEATLRIAEYACSIHGKQYAPTITTPYQLKDKISNLKAYKEKQEKSSEGIRII